MTGLFPPGQRCWWFRGFQSGRNSSSPHWSPVTNHFTVTKPDGLHTPERYTISLFPRIAYYSPLTVASQLLYTHLEMGFIKAWQQLWLSAALTFAAEVIFLERESVLVSFKAGVVFFVERQHSSWGAATEVVVSGVQKVSADCRLQQTSSLNRTVSVHITPLYVIKVLWPHYTTIKTAITYLQGFWLRRCSWSLSTFLKKQWWPLFMIYSKGKAGHISY